jgi:hypothetical protein
MSDHWNLLADQLGTPNLAPRSKKTPKTEAPSEPTAAIAPAKSQASSRPTDVPEETLSTPETLGSPGNLPGPNSDSKPEDKPRAARGRSTASSPKKPKPPTEVVQDNFGGGLSDSPASSEPNASSASFDTGEISEPVAPADSKPQSPASRSVESRPPAQRVKEPQAKEPQAKELPVKEPRERSMLQSSWDALANLFGVSSDSRREPAEAPVAPESFEPKAHEAKDSQDRNSQANRPSSKRSAPSSMWDSEEKTSASHRPQETIKNDDPVSTAPVAAPRNRRPDPRDQDSVE